MQLQLFDCYTLILVILFQLTNLLLTPLDLQLMILQDISTYEEYTGAAIVMLVVGITGLAICAPPFASLKGNSNTIKEIMELTSSSELRRMRPEGDEAAELLGGGHAEAWKAFLIEKGLKKR